jgi:acetyltransferase-like isoleucine patch superfamily enzyme
LGALLRRLRGLPPRDPRTARFLTCASLRWVVRHRAWTRWYLVRYLRLLRLRLTRPDIVLEGMVFLGRRVTLEVRQGYGRLILGRWVHLGDENRLRVHEGTMRIGDKCVFGRDNTFNCYLDVELGPGCLVADWVYLCDFDHVHSDLHTPIKDQGIVKSPVRIGADVWLGTKVTVLRGARIGTGVVVAAHAVVRGTVPSYAVVGGVPARVLKDRRAAYDAAAGTRAELAEIAARTARAAHRAAAGDQGVGRLPGRG